ncbi:MAG: CDF family Co(II)/Ni(II) efflux transporter DmeF [Magnetococcales bacterium]|nr:CDF family Co(II)/Ni(II) efflux transporter DmeF [Magnetococcales bacterium]
MTFISASGKGVHRHTFDSGNPLAERNTRYAAFLTLAMMVLEIIGGWLTNSMALLADGWHMSSHALALGLSVLAYRAARRFAEDRRFSFGSWKIEILGAYTSAIALAGIAAMMLYHSLERLLEPAPIHYDQAMILAFAGLLVNLACAWLLKDEDPSERQHAHVAHSHHSLDQYRQVADSAGHRHAHTHAGEHHHSHAHDSANGHAHDLNQHSALMHVLADAVTSVLALLALMGGKMWGANWLDPMMGIVGSVLVAVWAGQLLRATGRILLDAEMDHPLVEDIEKTLAGSGIDHTLSDLHLWRVGREMYACILVLETMAPIEPSAIRDLLRDHRQLVHVTVEINPRRLQDCPDDSCFQGRSSAPEGPRVNMGAQVISQGWPSGSAK